MISRLPSPLVFAVIYKTAKSESSEHIWLKKESVIETDADTEEDLAPSDTSETQSVDETT